MAQSSSTYSKLMNETIRNTASVTSSSRIAGQGSAPSARSTLVARTDPRITGTISGRRRRGSMTSRKVVRTAMENAASIAGLLLTTEALVTEIPEEEKEEVGHHHGHAH